MPRWIFASIGFLVALVTLGLGTTYGIDSAVSYAVSIHAERKAQHWSAHSLELVSDFDSSAFSDHDAHNHEPVVSPQNPIVDSDSTHTHHAEGGNPQPIAGAPVNVGVDDDILHLKLFDANGTLQVVSGESPLKNSQTATLANAEKMSRVANNGKAVVKIHKASTQNLGPAVFAEVFIPVVSAASNTIGVAEVYVDVSQIFTLFRGIVTNIILGLLTIFAIVFSVPFFAFRMKRAQEYRVNQRIEYLAKYDSMTNLLNRASFTEILQAKADSSAMPPAKAGFVSLDVDEIKKINDTYGHRAGDEFLKHVGRSICQHTGANDIVGRIGGDGFAFVVCNRSREEVEKIVDTIRSAIATPIHFDGVTLAGTVCFGIHYDESCNLPISERLQKAEMALYQAKADGRDVCRFFSQSIENELKRHRYIEAAIRCGLDTEAFELYFQPLLDRTSMKCAGFEALLRLRDNKGKMLSPEEFVPVAESMGVIDEIGTWVLNRATKVAATWPDHLFVAVNLSPSQFETGKLVKTVKDVLKTSGLAVGRLELEVTETLLMENTDSVAAQLNELHELGVLLAMDDFGTGYSSLGYLWQFGFDKLKIDRSFIAGLDENNEKACKILDTIIMLGHRLDMTVVAEGIETPAQADLLSSLSCDQFQGFLFARPMPIADLPSFFFAEFSAHSADEYLRPVKSA